VSGNTDFSQKDSPDFITAKTKKQKRHEWPADTSVEVDVAKRDFAKSRF